MPATGDSGFGEIQGFAWFQHSIIKAFLILGAFSRRFSGAKTALSALMKTLPRFHTASIACAFKRPRVDLTVKKKRFDSGLIGLVRQPDCLSPKSFFKRNLAKPHLACEN
jgi:hypothetical protein